MRSQDAGVSRITMLLTLTAVLGVGALGVILIVTRGPTPVQTKNILGETELCQSCHPVAEHKSVVGHAKLDTIGCVPCHGGEPNTTDKEKAHSPKLGEGPDPMLPKGQYQVACARCHVLGQVKGMSKLEKGHQSYIYRGTCVSCHGPGHRPPEIGPSLQTVAGKNVAYLRRWLLDSRSVLATAAMWSIRDGTYRGYFADTKEGNENLEALISYVLMVNDAAARRTYAAHAYHPKLRIDAPCTGCHLQADKAKAQGKAHRCRFLIGNAELNCKRCHGTPATAPKDRKGYCPVVSGMSYLCSTCHLRDGDGSRQLIEHDLAAK